MLSHRLPHGWGYALFGFLWGLEGGHSVKSWVRYFLKKCREEWKEVGRLENVREEKGVGKKEGMNLKSGISKLVLPNLCDKIKV